MAIERWRPGFGLSRGGTFKELEELGQSLEDIFRRPFLPSLLWRRSPLEEMGWVPAIEMFDKEDKLVVKAELPGMKEEDIDVSVEGNSLIIRGERKAETEIKEEDYRCCERSYGSFFRSITLPPQVDTAKVKAVYDKGILEIEIPKAKEAKATKVKISGKKEPSKLVTS